VVEFKLKQRKNAILTLFLGKGGVRCEPMKIDILIYELLVIAYCS
jgi:hypothetical protein